MADRSEWLITKENVEDEESRTSNKMSFYFVLKWINYEAGKKEVKEGNVFWNLLNSKRSTNMLTRKEEILATVYFQFLELLRYF